MCILVQEYLTRFAWLSEVFSEYLEKQDQIEMLNPLIKMRKSGECFLFSIFEIDNFSSFGKNLKKLSTFQ